MKKQQYDQNLIQLPEQIRNLDLAPIRMKLMQLEPEGKGWTEEQTIEADLWYRRYLAVCLKYGDQPNVPNWVIDQFWHQHILDTKKYMADSDAVFGGYLHHYPYFGLNGDAQERDEAFDDTNKFYRIEFGEDCTTIWGSNPSLCMEAVGCGGKGSGTGCRQKRLATAIGCNHSGSGTGCGQGGRGGKVAKAMGCNHSGSGTGCGQGGGRGR